MKREGQAWGLDATVASAIFVAGIAILFLYALNYKATEGEDIKAIQYEAIVIATTFLSEGEPAAWNQTTVTQMGILSDGKVNESKLTEARTLSTSQYTRTKALLNTKVDYFINFSRPITLNGTAFSGIGQAPNATAEQAYRVTRFTSYQNKPITLNVVAWRP